MSLQHRTPSLKGVVAPIAAILAISAALLIHPLTAAADIGGSTMTVGSLGTTSIGTVGSGTLTIVTSGFSDPVYCQSTGMTIQLPTDVVAPGGARFEYWYPAYDRDPVLGPNDIVVGGTFVSGGPVFARDLLTGLEYYLTSNNTWSTAATTWYGTFTPQAHGLYVVQDWIEFVNANGAIVSGWANEGFRGWSAYRGPHSYNSFISPYCGY